MIDHPYGHAAWAWVVVILGGPALFMLGRSRFEYEVFARVSISRVVVVAALVAVVLDAAASADARRAFGAPPEPPAPPL